MENQEIRKALRPIMIFTVILGFVCAGGLTYVVHDAYSYKPAREAAARTIQLEFNSDAMARWMDANGQTVIEAVIREDLGPMRKHLGPNDKPTIKYIVERKRRFGGSEPVERFIAYGPMAIPTERNERTLVYPGQTVEITRGEWRLEVTKMFVGMITPPPK